ncbi:MAG: hypothetical protein NT049_15055 [Planctomycetota bacterium]|nr:hypothetical protein [Planctomycetota bacterium]
MTKSTAAPLSPPFAPSARTRMMSVISGMIGGLAWFVMFGIMGFIVPRFEEVFAEMGAPLPGATQALIAAAHALRTFWPVAAVLVLGVPAAAVLLAVFARSSLGVTLARWLGLGSVLFMLVALMAVLFSLLIPLWSFMQATKG